MGLPNENVTIPDLASRSPREVVEMFLPLNLEQGVEFEPRLARTLRIRLPLAEARPRRRHRLTLLFHPGRVKRGVGPNEALGPPLRSGETFRLVVDAVHPRDALPLIAHRQ